MCQAPEWLQYAMMAYPALVLLRPMLPPQAQGPAGALLKVLDVVAGNYANCKNAPKVTDSQSKVTRR